MKLLLDENIAPRVADLLREREIDARHVSDYDLLGHADDLVMAAAIREDRVLVTADTDFGAILALTGAPRPSVLLLRGPGHSAEVRARQIADAVGSANDPLSLGALVVVEGARLRLRTLPIERA